MEKTIESTNYSIKVDLLKIIDRDNALENDHRWEETLHILIDAIDGVDDVTYNGHFGAFVFLQVDNRFDTDEKWVEIEAVITKYMEDIKDAKNY